MGGPGADDIRGAGGDDLLAPNHTTRALSGSDAGDAVDGGDGSDTVEYPYFATNRFVSLDDVADDGAAGEGDDIASTVENVKTFGGADVLVGNAAPNRLESGGGDDTLDGGGGADFLSGGDQTDAVTYAGRGTPVAVSLDDVANDGSGEEGDDVRSDVETVHGGAGPDRLAGSNRPERFHGGDGDDELLGGGGADELFGETGDDSLQGGTGDDGLRGGPGTDLAEYSDHGFGVTVTLAGGLDDGSAGEKDALSDLENVRGSAWPDALSGDSGPNVLIGGNSSDVLDGQQEADRLLGESGEDTLRGGTGADRLSGGVNTDTVTYAGRTTGVTADADDVADDGDASDGPAGARDDIASDVENLTGGSGGDALSGGPGANRLDGRSGGDVLNGGGGADALIGGLGDDALAGAGGADSMLGGAGVDLVSYADRTGRVVADLDGRADDGDVSDGPVNARDRVGADVETLIGGGGPDVLYGNGKANTLVGGLGADRLFGLAGLDVLRSRDGAPDAKNACGSEADILIADAGDPADPDCETITRE